MNKRIARKITKHVYEYVNWFLIDTKGYSREQVRSAMSKTGASKEDIKFHIHYYFGDWRKN